MNTHPAPSPLLAPFRSGALALPNRVVMAPMTRGRADEATGLPSPLTALYYQQRSSAGLIISEGIWPHHTAKGAPGSPGLETALQVAAWQEVTRRVHAAGGRIFAQLWDVGRVSHPLTLGGLSPSAPSAVAAAGQVYTRQGWQDHVEPQPLSNAQIQLRLAHFAQAARNARRAGFDGVEIHAANGYLPQQFLADNTNLRRDAYGGSPEKRGRFVLELVSAVAQAVGAQRVGVRLSPGNPEGDITENDPESVYAPLLARLYSEEIAYVHVAATPHFPALEAVRAWWPGTLIGNLSHDAPLTPVEGEALLERSLAELISFGRLFITNPDLPERIATRSELRRPVARHFTARAPTAILTIRRWFYPLTQRSIMKVGELARRTATTTRALRYYESIGILEPTRLANGYRTYTEADLERVRHIQLLFRSGLCGSKIATVLHLIHENEHKTQRENESGDPADVPIIDPELAAAVADTREIIAAHIAELSATLGRLDALIDRAAGRPHSR